MSGTLFKAHLAFDREGKPWRTKVTEWLRENDRAHHFVNAYHNGHPLRPTIIVVLNDRTTAIMLKLALA